MTHAPKSSAPPEIAVWLRELVANCLELPVDRIDPQVALTRYGLDSVRAIQLTTEIATKLQRTVPETLLLACPCVAKLESFMLELLSGETQSGDLCAMLPLDGADATLGRLLADSILPEDIWPEAVYNSGSGVRSNPENVLLTGATGFLGAYMLCSLLRSTSATVHCLVRQSDEAPLERIRRNLTKYDLWDERYAERLQGWAGDLQMPQLGLPPQGWAWLSQAVDTIFHCGATVNWVMPYDALRNVNVLGTQELLRLACQGRAKAFHFVSSLATCHTTSVVGQVTEQDESLALAAGNYLGYAQSKCVAESLVHRASERGLPATIHRPSLIIGARESAYTNTEDLLSSMICGCIAMRAAPNLDWVLDCCTVDFIAEAIVELSLTSTVPLRVSHLVNPARYHWREVVLWMNLYGFQQRLISYRQWLAELRIAASAPSHPLYRLRSFFLARPKAGCNLTLPELYEESRRNSVEAQITERELARLGLKCPALSVDLLEVFFSRLIKQGAVPAVRERLPSVDLHPIAKAEHVDLDSGFFESLLREHFGDNALHVRRLSKRRLSNQSSITTELASWRSSRRIGLWECCVEFAKSGEESTQELEFLVKVKPSDQQVIEVAEQVGAICDSRLGEMLCHHRDRLGILGCHTRELKVYSQLDQRFVAHVPRVYGVIENSEQSEWLLVLESLKQIKLMDSAHELAQWQPEDIEVVLQGLAQLHSVWFQRDAELSEQAWLRPPLTSDELEDMAGLWHALAEYSWRYFSDWVDAEACEVILNIVTEAGNWWKQLEKMPRTLIHNDFNPRNLALRMQDGAYRLVAYDWELATIGVPQHDLAEFLCFVLPQDCSQATITKYVELYRANLAVATGRQIDPVVWHTGFRLSLCYLILNRFPMYCLRHTFSCQNFLPKVIKTWWQLHKMLNAESNA
ncbi:MAG: thioester reductase domain-containing protein [Pirellulaceae bacterium]